MDGLRGMRKKVRSEKELTEVGKMAEGYRVGREEGCVWRDLIREYGDFL
jgi:hypothetical protein